MVCLSRLNGRKPGWEAACFRIGAISRNSLGRGSFLASPSGQRPPGWVLRIVSALFVAWIVVDGIYVLYHTLMGNEMFRIENFYASSALYLLAGSIWLYRGSLREFLANVREVFRSAV